MEWFKSELFLTPSVGRSAADDDRRSDLSQIESNMLCQKPMAKIIQITILIIWIIRDRKNFNFERRVSIFSKVLLTCKKLARQTY